MLQYWNDFGIQGFIDMVKPNVVLQELLLDR